MLRLLLLLFPCVLLAAEPPEDRRYDEVAWLCAHNAMNNQADGWKVPNQNKNVGGQFQDGVRAFMLDLHPQDGTIVLRHGPAAARWLGFKPLNQELSEVRDLLEKNPRCVITLILESYVPAKDVGAAFQAAGLDRFAHTQDPKQPWPTLAAMIAANHRLVILSDRAAGGPPWILDVWKQAWETPFSAKTKEDLKNVPNRGNPKNALLILNHFCANPLPSRSLAGTVNAKDFLGERLRQAQRIFGRKPNFIAVDFHDLGDPASTVAELNR